MKSQKELKRLNEITLPFLLKPTKTIEGSVNGKKFYFERGKQYEITLAEFEVLYNAGYDIQS